MRPSESLTSTRRAAACVLMKNCAISSGISTKILSGSPIVDVMYPDDLAETLSVFGHLASGDVPCFTMERRFVRKENSLIWT